MATQTADRGVTARQALGSAARALEAAEVDAPRLAAEALLAHALQLDRAHALAHLSRPLSPDQLTAYRANVERCAAGEPLAYVLGQREFYGLDFRVDARVLIPRPETELLVEEALQLAGRAGSDYRIVDVGTGSGAIVVTLAVHLPCARLVAIDISPDAVAVATDNARRHGVADRIAFRVGDLLEPLDAPADLIVANLPYVRSREWAHLARSIRHHEPAQAFDGGSDGLELVSRLLRAAPNRLRPRGSMLLEIGASHGEAAIELARDSFPAAAVAVRPDTAGLDRLLVIRT